ncbi:MAG: hypothetical protein WD048_15880 [Chitinophagales bacterium]
MVLKQHIFYLIIFTVITMTFWSVKKMYFPKKKFSNYLLFDDEKEDKTLIKNQAIQFNSKNNVNYNTFIMHSKDTTIDNFGMPFFYRSIYQYPSVHGMKDSIAQKKINSLIKINAKSDWENSLGFNYEVKEVKFPEIALDRIFPKSISAQKAKTLKFHNASFIRVNYLNNHIINFTKIYRSIPPDGKITFYTEHCVTINIHNLDTVGLNKILKPSYKDFVKEYFQKTSNSSFSTTELKTFSVNKAYCFTAKSVVFTISIYSNASYDYLPYEVEIPFTQLSEIIKKNGLLAELSIPK